MSEHYGPEWATLSINWPREKTSATIPANGDAAHKLVAKAAAASADDPRCHIPPEVFHHYRLTDGRQAPLGGLSPFRFAGHPSRMSITAVGNEAVDTLESCGHRIVRCVSRFAGRPLRETWVRGSLSLRSSRQIHTYSIPYMVVTRKPLRKIEVGEQLAAKELTPDVRRWVGNAVLSGLARQARLVGLDEPPEDVLLRVDEIDGMLGWSRGANNAYYGSVARGVRFSTELQIHGPWSVGALCLVGEGQVYRTHPEKG